jgi:hypothetical protein
LKSREPLRAAAALLLLTLPGCPGEVEQRGRGEAERVARAVSVLREADNAAKRPLLNALSAQRCTEPPVCELQRTCAEAYRGHLDGVQKSEAVRQKLDAPEGGAPLQSAELLQELDTAEHMLHMARESVRQCADLEGKLRRKYRL